ncbi:hypothetical protein KA107_02590 [Candidatus Pacearchaeota archaeon]|nr:hypothetical protein [Candidatus Pacearchaeota archaeon]
MFTKHFLKAYHKSLKTEYRMFYDDFAEYGNSKADHAIYFIEGIGGTPGQIRFAMSSIVKVFGTDIYIKCLNLPEFSAQRTIFEKYNSKNVDKKRNKIIKDLNDLGKKHKKITIFASSNGFYDLVYAYPKISKQTLKKAKLVWCSIAPDHFEPTNWEKFFFGLNGLIIDGHKWFAVPNSNKLKLINPEMELNHVWQHNDGTRVFSKDDLEFRFRCFGFNWDYSSVTCFNSLLERVTKNAKLPLDIPAYILLATNDGYWQGKPTSEMYALLDKYLSNKKVIAKDASHLWLLMPDAVQEILELSKS